MNPQELKKKLDTADVEKVHQFMKMFDRILLYTLAVNAIPKEDIESTLDLWNRVVAKGIDLDAIKRTDFLESTREGRIAKLYKEPDGEALRLHLLKQKDIAEQIIRANLHQNPDMDSEGV